MPQGYSEMLAEYLLDEEPESVPLPPKEKSGNKPEKNGRKSPKGSSESKNIGKTSTKEKKDKKSKQGPATKQWVHPPEALVRGHIVYNVKFLGYVTVDQPKGTEVVRDAIRKMKFGKQIKKAEGQKPPKVELTISVDGVTIQEPKTKIVHHKYSLHRISYCADDKADKRMFTFIAKKSDSDEHDCFVFDSEKCAEEITLTIGQAFDLAYRRFLESSNKDLDMKKQYLVMQKKVQQLTQENVRLKGRIADLERLVDPQALENWDKKRVGLTPSKQPVVGTKLENLVLEEGANKNAAQRNGFTPSGPPGSIPALTPPPPVPHRSNIGVSSPTQPIASPTKPGQEVDLFGATPFNNVMSPQTEAPPPGPQNPFTPTSKGGDGSGDAFGMEPFQPSAQELDQQIQNVDKELMDLQTGFSQGLSFGADDFTLADLDPLNKK